MKNPDFKPNRDFAWALIRDSFARQLANEYLRAVARLPDAVETVDSAYAALHKRAVDRLRLRTKSGSGAIKRADHWLMV